MEKRGLLLLNDPLRHGSRFSQMHMDTKALILELRFTEGEPYLSQAQAALWRLRRECGWVCVAAEGCAAWIALALAAQLMVERLALWMEPAPEKLPRQMQRLQLYVRRNLSLLASEILLAKASDAELRMLSRGLSGSCELRRISGEVDGEELLYPWTEDLFSLRH